MKKQKKQMILMLALLLIVIGALVGLRIYNDAQANKQAEAEGEVIIDMEYADAELLSYVYEGETYSFERIDDIWYVAGDHSKSVKQSRIQAMMLGVTPFVAEQVIENVTDFAQYGLDEPQNTIVFGNDMEQFTLSVGDYNSFSATNYVRLNDSATVYVVKQACVTRFNQTLDDLVEEVAEEAETAEEVVGNSTEDSAESSTVDSTTDTAQ